MIILAVERVPKKRQTYIIIITAVCRLHVFFVYYLNVETIFFKRGS